MLVRAAVTGRGLLHVLAASAILLAAAGCKSTPPAPPAAAAPATAAPAPATGPQWSQWRGPLGTGAAPDATPPLH